jgi:uncharacterized membrane protein YdjX (TVP38/TMEM64 family)
MLTWRFTPLAEVLTADRASEWAQQISAYWWAPLAIVLAYTPASLIMFPRPLITLAAVVAFGAWLGFAYAVSGILLSAAVHYVAGRMLDRDTVRRLAGEKLNRMTHVLRQRGLIAMTALRLVPIAPFAVEGFVAGAVRIKLWHFLIGTLIGILPGALAATVFADQLGNVLRDNSQINWWLVAAVAIVFAVALVLVRRWFNRQQNPKRPQTQTQRLEPTLDMRIKPVAFASRSKDGDRALSAMNADRV